MYKAVRERLDGLEDCVQDTAWINLKSKNSDSYQSYLYRSIDGFHYGSFGFAAHGIYYKHTVLDS